MRQILTLPILLLCFSCMAQLPDFGEIDIADLKMKECAFEKTANALVLFDAEIIRVTEEGYSLRITTEKRVRIKIFNHKGFSYANIKIPYINRDWLTKMKDVSAICYNLDENGKIVVEKVDRKRIYKNNSDEDIRTISFTFPKLKEGSVIEYKYTIIDHAREYVRPWIFQRDIPINNTFWTISLPGFQKLNYRVLGQMPIDKFEPADVSKYSDEKEKKLRFSAANVPSFRAEPLMSSIIDYIPRIEFNMHGDYVLNTGLSLAEKWGSYNKRMLISDHFGGQLFKEIPKAKNVIDTAKLLSNDDDKIAYLFAYVQKNISWDKSKTIYADDLIEVWDRKTGSSADLNLLLFNLLLKSGVDCLPVLVRTREQGKIDLNYPGLEQFTTVDVLTNDDNHYVIDATEKYISHKVPPFNVLNRYGFAIDSANGRWLLINDYRPLMKTNIIIEAKLDSNKKVIGDAVIRTYDYSKQFILAERELKASGEEENSKENLISLTVSDISEEGADKVSEPLVRKFKYTHEVNKSGDFYHFNPIMLNSLIENPFTAETRQTDIDMGANQYLSIILSLTIPDELEVESIPKEYLLRNNDTTIVFSRSSAVNGQKIVFKINLELTYNIVAKEDYPELREFYKKLYDLLHEEFVFRRKS